MQLTLIYEVCPEGIQKSGTVSPGAFEIKFGGIPWWALAESSQINARVLFAEVLRDLEAVGFDLLAPISCTVGQGVRDSAWHDREWPGGCADASRHLVLRQ